MFNDKEEFVQHLEGNKVLIVSFAGLEQGMGMPVFEFVRFLSSFDIDKVFIRDLRQLWYQSGIYEASSINSLKDKLANIISKNNYERVIFIGNSMGGFAAILYGIELNVDKILAFSPQTFIDSQLRNKFGDNRWENKISIVQKVGLRQKEMDLKKSIEKLINQKTELEIHYSANFFLDKIHAERFKVYKNVSLFSYRFGDHSIIKDLRDKGELVKILKRIIY